MILLYPSYLWLLLVLVPFFIKRDFKKYRVTFYGYLLTFIFIVLALSRPVIEQEPIKSEQHLSDVIIAQDLSFSMYAQDIEPSRIAYSKKMLKRLLYTKQKSRFGVLGFTTNAIILSPLTEDRELLEHLFDSLDEKFIITKGSDIMSVLKLSKDISSSKRARVVIFSDGADKLDYSAEARFAKANNLIVNIFMTATEVGGVLRLESGGLLKDDDGDIVVTRQNSAIKAISEATGGVFTKDFDELLSALEKMDEDEYKSEVNIIRNLELFYYFVALAIITFLLSVTTLKRFIILFLLLFGVHLNADKNFNKAVEFYRAGEYEKALENFELIKSGDSEIKSIIYYNIGNSLVRLKEFEKAREAYLKSLTLEYSKEADENLEYIIDAGEEKKMNQGKDKNNEKSSLSEKQSAQKKQKEGGGSNMQVSVATSGASDDKGKKTEMRNSINLNSGKAKLSSKQYELINKRSVDEKKPW
ncbi:MAG TPA: VWA domain-containing protein [Sulfurimonas sp.]|uniref:VWA domain-containing protein n=1 Tax=Sulfurimonas sp. TaxID=2022749 RepID=UPI002BB35AE6|nr:VWA domain-containing protein [Sulfurimonas sp.]HUH41928.1 VWA domain-containing protein [Sulfurimonas sp.]